MQYYFVRCYQPLRPPVVQDSSSSRAPLALLIKVPCLISCCLSPSASLSTIYGTSQRLSRRRQQLSSFFGLGTLSISYLMWLERWQPNDVAVW